MDSGADDLVAFLRRPGWQQAAAAVDGERYRVNELDYAPENVVCVGLNYRSYILEMGREVPAHPTVFSKYARALVGLHDDVVLPTVSMQVDGEAELAVIIGAEVWHVDPDEARAAIAGYSVLNDVTVRDWQKRTTQ